MTTYVCRKCSAPAKVEGGALIPSCGCLAGFFANLRAVARGAGALK